jgi:hypothetical protein
MVFILFVEILKLELLTNCVSFYTAFRDHVHIFEELFGHQRERERERETKRSDKTVVRFYVRMRLSFPCSKHIDDILYDKEIRR